MEGFSSKKREIGSLYLFFFFRTFFHVFLVPKVASIEFKKHHLRQASFYLEYNEPKEIFISKGKHTIILVPDSDRRNDPTVSSMGSS